MKNYRCGGSHWRSAQVTKFGAQEHEASTTRRHFISSGSSWCLPSQLLRRGRWDSDTRTYMGSPSGLGLPCSAPKYHANFAHQGKTWLTFAKKIDEKSTRGRARKIIRKRRLKLLSTFRSPGGEGL